MTGHHGWDEQADWNVSPSSADKYRSSDRGLFPQILSRWSLASDEDWKTHSSTGSIYLEPI